MFREVKDAEGPVVTVSNYIFLSFFSFFGVMGEFTGMVGHVQHYWNKLEMFTSIFLK